MRTTTTLFILLLAQLCAAQRDSSYMQPRSDGQIDHSLPPPANIVSAGYALEYAAINHRDAIWLRLAGLAIAGTIYTAQDEPNAVPWVIGAAGIAYSVVLDFRANKSTRYTGNHLKSGYSVNTRYDIVPDDIAPGPHLRLMLPPTTRMRKPLKRQQKWYETETEKLLNNAHP